MNADQSRKRGTLESDLLLSTFADVHLGTLTAKQLQQYDFFLDENDWDIYYWATQDPPSTGAEATEGIKSETQGKDQESSQVKDKQAESLAPSPRPGEWAQTVGTFKPAYRPVPSRWKDSEILLLLRQHVKERSAGGVKTAKSGKEGQGLNQHIKGTGGGGLGFMPAIRNFDA